MEVLSTKHTILKQRQQASGGLIKKKTPNLWVQVQGREAERVHVYVNLETDAMKSAWIEAREVDGSIGPLFEMFYKGYFRPRHTPLAFWGVKKDDVITLIPQTDPSWIQFFKQHPLYHNQLPWVSPQHYENWARN